MITKEIKSRLMKAGGQIKKSLGQNFLINESIYAKMVESLGLKPGGKVLEIGPGLGILSDQLLSGGAKLTIVEKDDAFSVFLEKRFRERATVVNEDILKFSPSDMGFKDFGYKVVGNIPYYLTSNLLRTILDAPKTSGTWPKPECLVFMIQKEVAQRIVAKPPKMSLLSVSVQYFSKPEIVAYVSKGNFYPQPKVDSAIIKIIIDKQEPGGSKDNFFKTVRAGFSGKRKQLINNLSSKLNKDKKVISEILAGLSIDPKRRAETLSIEEWQKISSKILGS